MAKVKEHHFDISAKLDMQELKNAVIQAQKERKLYDSFDGSCKELQGILKNGNDNLGTLEELIDELNNQAS